MMKQWDAGKRFTLTIVFWLLVLAVAVRAQTGASFYLQEGIKAYQQGDFEKAYQNFRQYEPIGQPDKTFYVYFAMSADRSGRDEAVSILERGLRRYPGDSDLTLVLVQLLGQKKEFRKAIAFLKKAKASIASEEYKRLLGVLNFNAGVQLYQQNRKKESVAYFEQAATLQPDEPRFVRNLAIVLWETGQKQRAIRLLEKALKRFPEDADVNRLLITFYQKTGDVRKLQTRLEENARRSKSLNDYLALQQFYLLTGNESKARALFRKLQREFPDKKEIYLTPVRYYRRVFQYERADSVLSQMEKRFPGDTLVCSLKARNYEDMDSLKQAAAYWQKCLARYPYKSDWHFRLLDDLWQIDSTRYFAHLKKMESLLSDSESRLHIALKWMEHRRYRNALPILRQLVRFDSTNGLFLTYLGLCYARQGQDSLAVQTFRRAIRTGDAAPQAYLGLAHYAWRRGESKKSDFYFSAGLEQLLASLKEQQGQLLLQVKKATSTENAQKLKRLVAANEDYEQLLKDELHWYQKHHPPTQTEAFLNRLLQRFPKNAFLRLLLADLMLQQGNFSQAQHYVDDVLFMKPDWPQALRFKIRLAKAQGDTQAVFRGYLNLLYHHSGQMTRKDFRALIESARAIGQIKNLAQQLLLLHERHPENQLLKEFTIEALHLAGDHARARQVAAEKPRAARKAKSALTPLIETHQ
jgi:tetratricopeptide (TPR) repeat protein